MSCKFQKWCKYFGGEGSGCHGDNCGRKSENSIKLPINTPDDTQIDRLKIAGGNAISPPLNKNELDKLGEETNTIPGYNDPVRNYISNAKTQDEVVNDMMLRLSDLGINKKDLTHTTSNTDYGRSDYITTHTKDGELLKIRISDHSVQNVSRMANEIHTDRYNMGDRLYQVEKKMFPDRFGVLKTMDVKTKNGITEVKILARKKT